MSALQSFCVRTIAREYLSVFWECQSCGKILKPEQGDCCVYCSYGSVPSPSKKLKSDIMLKKLMQKMKRNKVQKSSNWNTVSGKENLNTLLKRSEDHPQVIYKHSSRCSISYLTKEDLEENMDALSNHADMHFIDVIDQRDLSDDVAESLNVRHESPQALLLKNGRVAWSGSHWDVKGENILSELR